MAKLSNKQRVFIDEYLIDLNATQSAIRAGYNPNAAKDMGYRNLNNDKIKSEIAKAMADRSRRTGINADRVLEELAKIGFLNPADVVNVKTGVIKNNASNDDLSAIQVIKVKESEFDSGSSTECEIRFHDKHKALELLGKHLGIFSDRLKIDGNIPVIITGSDELE